MPSRRRSHTSPIRCCSIAIGDRISVLDCSDPQVQSGSDCGCEHLVRPPRKAVLLRDQSVSSESCPEPNEPRRIALVPTWPAHASDREYKRGARCPIQGPGCYSTRHFRVVGRPLLDKLNRGVEYVSLTTTWAFILTRMRERLCSPAPHSVILQAGAHASPIGRAPRASP